MLEAAVIQAAGPSFRLFDKSFYEKETPDRDRLPEQVQRRVLAELNGRYTDQVQQTAHTLFKNRIGLQQVLTTSARMTGNYHGSEVIRDNGDLETVLRAANWIRADGASTASLANVLANVLNKFLLQGYLFVEQSWREIAGIRPVKDFKPTKSVNLFGDFEYKDVGPSGELKHAELRDQAFSNQAATSGRILTITRTHTINDDLSALTTVPMLMGRGAALKLNKSFWTMFLNPGVADDAVAFWSASHVNGAGVTPATVSNYSSGAGSTLSSAGLNAATVLFDNMTDPMGYPLGVDAEILLYPPDLQTAALELMNSQFIVYGGASASKQPGDNVWKGRYKPVKSRYLNKAAFTGYSTTAWYLLANPSMFPTIEVAFLNGQDMPTVQTAQPDYQFEVLGISIRGFFDTGVNIQNFRGGVKSAGA